MQPPICKAAISGENVLHAIFNGLSGRIFYNFFRSLRLCQGDFELKHCSNIVLRREPSAQLLHRRSNRIRTDDRKEKYSSLTHRRRWFPCRLADGYQRHRLDPSRFAISVGTRFRARSASGSGPCHWLFLIVEIDPRLQPDIDASRNDPDRDVRRHQYAHP